MTKFVKFPTRFPKGTEKEIIKKHVRNASVFELLENFWDYEGKKITFVVRVGCKRRLIKARVLTEVKKWDEYEGPISFTSFEIDGKTNVGFIF